MREMEITENTVIENGWVMGHVSTKKVGSTCSFRLCTVEEWEEMDEQEADKLLMDVVFDNGIIEAWY